MTPAPEAPSLAAEAQKLRSGPNRDLVLGVLRQSVRPMSAYDILAVLRQDKNLSPISIYRALSHLRKAGAIHRLESLNAFVTCRRQHAEGVAHVFCICEECGTTDEFPASELMSGVRDYVEGRAFRVTQASFELRGHCHACTLRGHPLGARGADSKR
jgi:Fur family transcriptional regulator, zinc uptake regulator